MFTDIFYKHDNRELRRLIQENAKDLGVDI